MSAGDIHRPKRLRTTNVFFLTKGVHDTHCPQSDRAVMSDMGGDLGHTGPRCTRSTNVTFLNGPKGPVEFP